MINAQVFIIIISVYTVCRVNGCDDGNGNIKFLFL